MLNSSQASLPAQYTNSGTPSWTFTQGLRMQQTFSSLFRARECWTGRGAFLGRKGDPHISTQPYSPFFIPSKRQDCITQSSIPFSSNQLWSQSCLLEVKSRKELLREALITALWHVATRTLWCGRNRGERKNATILQRFKMGSTSWNGLWWSSDEQRTLLPVWDSFLWGEKTNPNHIKLELHVLIN